MSRGAGTGEKKITGEQASLAATEIIDFSAAIKRAVRELQISGCSDTEISFENNEISDYTNTNAPIDKSCHIFHPNGGALRMLSFTSLNEHVELGFISQQNIVNVGTTDADLLFKIHDIPLDICIALNKKNNIATLDEASEINAAEIDSAETCLPTTPACQFTGSYSNSYTISSSHENMCLKEDGVFTYIKVLIAR